MRLNSVDMVVGVGPYTLKEASWSHGPWKTPQSMTREFSKIYLSFEWGYGCHYKVLSTSYGLLGTEHG
jgi:hypothetical protein